jgi:hypothetical protein
MNIKYIANDGTEFWSAEECYTYELKDKAYESKDIILSHSPVLKRGIQASDRDCSLRLSNIPYA